MGVVQVIQRPRTQLPPGRAGIAKPSFATADRSGEQAAFGAVVSVAGGIFNKIIQAQENEQVSTFEGAYDSEVIKFSGLIRSNPGASEEQVEKWMKEANTNIDKAGAVPTNRNARTRVRNTITKNLPAFQSRMKADWAAIESKRMLDNLNDEIEIAVQELDKVKVEKLITEASGNLMDPEQKELTIKLKNLRIDKLAEGVARQAEAELERQVIDGQVDYINGLPYKEREAALQSLTGLENADRNEIRARVERQMELEMEAVELSAREKLLGDSMDISGAKAIINDNLDNFGTDWHTDALNKVQNAAGILAKKGVNPYTTTTDWNVYDKDEKLAFDGKLNTTTISKHTGPDGYSDTEARRLRAIIKDPVGESDPILTDALSEVEAIADLQRKALGDIKDLSDKPQAKLRKDRTQILREANELKQQLRRLKIQKPDMTPDQYHSAIDGILQPVKENAAKDASRTIWESITAGELGTGAAPPFGFTPSTPTLPTTKRTRVQRDRLQAVFEQLTEEEKKTAEEALRQGKTPEEIVTFFEANK